MKNLKPYLVLGLAFMLLAAIYSCNAVDPQKYVGTALDPLTDPAKVDTTKFNVEYLSYSTVKINGVLPLESTFAQFKKVIGEPDSVVNFNSNTDCQFYEEPYRYIYFKKSMYFLVKDTAIFQSIYFPNRPDLELVSPVITLNAHTTLKDVQRLFPEAVREIRTVNTEFGPLQMVSLGASKEYADEWWLLSFDGNKLVVVEMYTTC